MTEKECLYTAVGLSLFAHFLLLIAPGPRETPHQATQVVLQLDMDSVALAPAAPKGVGLSSIRPESTQDAKAADRKRQAFLGYLEAVDQEVHSRRLETGSTGLIGVATCSFVIRPDGTFSEPAVHTSSGDPDLDAAALRAIRAASGKIRRPAIIGTDPVPMTLQVKYQYNLR